MAIALPEQPLISKTLHRRVVEDYERWRGGLPADLPAQLVERYGVDLTGEYAGRPINSPFGKASGQLSLNLKQVERDVEAGLGFVVLKTVIAQDAGGQQMMREWAIHETHMKVERIVGPRSGEEGWTVTWKGRGWWDSFESYLELFAKSLEVGAERGMVVAPSVKYHLPTPDEPEFKTSEYQYTTQQLVAVWAATQSGAMPLEKDFSPTLAGSEKSKQQDQILLWLQSVPGLIKHATEQPIELGLKVMNAMFDDDFQLAMLRTVIEQQEPRADFIVYANRLFDPTKEFEGKVGVAYGGPDLSLRNLALLERLQATSLAHPCQPISATGNILDGRTAVEYGLRGCTSFQMHTLFQLPDSLFGGTMSNKTEKCLHHLYLHPESGLVPWLLHLAEQHGCRVDGLTRVLDLPRWGSG
ncbi:MAG: hypothetical protein HUU35_08935 [Armatimonadetes bacterium]|nr:hypothetical protein [Armatimonadota bacterium]